MSPTASLTRSDRTTLPAEEPSSSIDAVGSVRGRRWLTLAVLCVSMINFLS